MPFERRSLGAYVPCSLLYFVYAAHSGLKTQSLYKRRRFGERKERDEDAGDHWRFTGAHAIAAVLRRLLGRAFYYFFLPFTLLLLPGLRRKRR
jgi:hypothetical protein